MGLYQVELEQGQNRAIVTWLPILGMTAIIVVLGLFADPAREALAFYRPAVASGEAWRLFTAHFVHLGVPHQLLNLAGLWLVWYLVSAHFGAFGWLAILLITIAGIDVGLWFLSPQLQWYVGLSGVLHGLLVAGLLAGFHWRRADHWVLAIALTGKIAFEQLFGPMPGSESTSGGSVIVDAHLYGAVAGAAAGWLMTIRVGSKAPI